MGRPVRRSQAIAPFGIGALVDFPGPVSLIHAGLDAWPFQEENPAHREFKIEDEKRLSRRLGVDYFVQPPDFRQPEKGQDATQANMNLKLPFLRFPLWHVCPRCGRMHVARYHDIAAPVCKGPVGSGSGRGSEHTPRKAIQVRFVAACKNGHLQDFPWTEWLFKHSDPEWTADGISRWLRLRSTGSASLTGVEISAEQRDSNGAIIVVAKRTLAGAFQVDALGNSNTPLTKIGVKCQGHNPALAIGVSSNVKLPGCGQQLFPLLRGSSNLYFPHIVSSIYIPDVDDRELTSEILDLLDDYDFKRSLLNAAKGSDDGLITAKRAKICLKEYYPELEIDPNSLAEAANKHILKDVLIDERKIQAFLSQKIKADPDRRLTSAMIAAAIEYYCPEWEIDPVYLLPPLSAWFSNAQTDLSESEARQDTLIETDYRRQEYSVFCRDIEEGLPKTNLLIRSSAIDNYERLVSFYFDRVSLLHKLRETRAFVGYSRIFPENDLTQQDRASLISHEKKSWLPAAIVRGEGIFLKFREERVAEWLGRCGAIHETRLSSINHNLGEMRARRNQPPKEVTPKHILIHTLAHLLINELVYKCGYGSASLRERIYTSDGSNPMSGVLIYTAAGDSEGTMGGLVKMGQPGYLEPILASTIEKAGWCSSDPVCIESRGQGPDSCNLGACHSCALLPETSCEEQNRLLDRGVVIGTLEQPNIGYFSRQW
jgi:hypothetical protein